jgi:hypothetical protein
MNKSAFASLLSIAFFTACAVDDPVESPQHDVDRQRHQRRLHDGPDDDVESVATEIVIDREVRVFLQHRFTHGTPPAPRPDASVEVLEQRHVVSWGQQGHDHAADRR